MARQTRSSRQDSKSAGVSSSPVSSKTPSASTAANKKRKRQSVANPDDQPAAKQRRSESDDLELDDLDENVNEGEDQNGDEDEDVKLEERSSPVDMDEKSIVEDAPDAPKAKANAGLNEKSVGDLPLDASDAHKLLDVLEMIDSQGLLDRVFPLPADAVSHTYGDAEGVTASTPQSVSLRALLQDSQTYPIRVLRTAISNLLPLHSHPRSRPSAAATKQLRFCQHALSLIDEASTHITPLPDVLPDFGDLSDFGDFDANGVNGINGTTTNGKKARPATHPASERKYALLQRLPTGEWWTSLSTPPPRTAQSQSQAQAQSGAGDVTANGVGAAAGAGSGSADSKHKSTSHPNPNLKPKQTPEVSSLLKYSTGHAELVAIVPTPSTSTTTTATTSATVNVDAELIPRLATLNMRTAPRRPAILPSWPRHLSTASFLDYSIPPDPNPSSTSHPYSYSTSSAYASFAPSYDSRGGEVGRAALEMYAWERRRRGEMREKARTEMVRRVREVVVGRMRTEETKGEGMNVEAEMDVEEEEGMNADADAMAVDGEDAAAPTLKGKEKAQSALGGNIDNIDVQTALDGILAPEEIAGVQHVLDGLSVEASIQDLLDRNAEALKRLQVLQLARLAGPGGPASSGGATNKSKFEVEVGSEEWETAQTIAETLAIIASLRPRVATSNNNSSSSPSTDMTEPTALASGSGAGSTSAAPSTQGILTPTPQALHALQRSLPTHMQTTAGVGSASRGWRGTLPPTKARAMRDDRTVYIKPGVPVPVHTPGPGTTGGGRGAKGYASVAAVPAAAGVATHTSASVTPAPATPGTAAAPYGYTYATYGQYPAVNGYQYPAQAAAGINTNGQTYAYPAAATPGSWYGAYPGTAGTTTPGQVQNQQQQQQQAMYQNYWAAGQAQALGYAQGQVQGYTQQAQGQMQAQTQAQAQAQGYVQAQPQAQLIQTPQPQRAVANTVAPRPYNQGGRTGSTPGSIQGQGQGYGQGQGQVQGVAPTLPLHLRTAAAGAGAASSLAGGSASTPGTPVAQRNGLIAQ